MPAVPTKAALYFESVEELGPWRILISSRADRDLRALRRGDAKMFRIVMKKMKELSNGHFSDDNQKRLTGRDSVVDIYGTSCSSTFLYVSSLYMFANRGQDDQRPAPGRELSRTEQPYCRSCIAVSC